MKKISIYIYIVAAIIGVSSCKKDPAAVSKIVTASWPTITINGPLYYSINVGASAPTVSATAYDSFLKENCDVQLDASSIDNSIPGLYFASIVTKNSNGYVTSQTVYVAVTDISDDLDQSGTFTRAATGGSANIVKRARGLYETDNVGGNAGAATHALFVQTSPTECIIPSQPTIDGDMIFPTTQFDFDEGGILQSYTYTIDLSGYGPAPRTFARD